MSGFIDFFVPREKKFFEQFQNQVKLLYSGAESLTAMSKKNPPTTFELKKTLAFIEDKSDESEKISHEITEYLHQTFITPIDREEIQAISTNINRVIDSIEKIAAGILFFKIKKLDRYFLKQLIVLKKTAETLTLIFQNPLSIKANRPHLETVRKLEKEGDELFKKGIGYIFNNNHSAIDVIKQKELYEITEEAIDDMQFIADIMQTVLINHS